jgi:Tol biopolymer transport system component
MGSFTTAKARGAVLVWLIAATLAAAPVTAVAGPDEEGSVTVVSVASTGQPGMGQSNLQSAQTVSADGRYVAFDSKVSSLVEGDVNDARDVFVRDRLTGTTKLVSATAAGAPGQNASDDPAMTPDGRYIAFTSTSPDLVPGDTNRRADVFLRDMHTGTTRRVSVTAQGRGPNGDSSAPAISPDARYVAFASTASNLVPKDTNRSMDVFLRDLQSGGTTLLSADSTGRQLDGPSGLPVISADARVAAFVSMSTSDPEHFDAYVRDLATGSTRLVSAGSNGHQPGSNAGRVGLSADGQRVIFATSASDLVVDDTNRDEDVFVRDLNTGDLDLVSIGMDGGPGNAGSGLASISADGRVAAFSSTASDLVSDDTNETSDVFVRDLQAGVTRLISVGSAGQGNGPSDRAAASVDGQHVAFQSDASNFTEGDVNEITDVFVWDATPETAYAPARGSTSMATVPYSVPTNPSGSNAR